MRSVIPLLLLGLPLPAAAHAPTLVYGPLDNGEAASLAAGGNTVTVWSEAEWRVATTADFKAFGVIYIPDGVCTGAPASAWEALDETQDAWVPAIGGPTVVSGLAVGCHIGSVSAAGDVAYDTNDWAAVSTLTGLVVSPHQGVHGLDFLDTMGAFGSAATTADSVTLTDPSHAIWAYGLTGTDMSGWGDSVGSILTAWPSDFAVAATDDSGDPVILLREDCDQDFDGFASAAGSCGGTDCDDSTWLVYPGAWERCDDLDNDCDSIIDESPALYAPEWYADADDDGFGDATAVVEACDQPSGYVDDDTDCDDEDAAVHPDATERCNLVDDDCDTEIDGLSAVDIGTWYTDGDGDGFGQSESEAVACFPRADQVDTPGDCDDGDSAVHPDAIEICNKVDDDCDTFTDEADAADAEIWYADTDGDGFGDPLSATPACNMPSGFVANDADCDDYDPDAWPGAAEIWYDGSDQACDGWADEYDADGDGFSAEVGGGLDCDDTSADTHPGAAEIWYDGMDQNCDGMSDYDADADGFEADFSDGTDCDDDDPAVFPGAPETWYDGIDQDCNGTDGDADGDGYIGLEAGGTDCDDSWAAVHPDAPEVWYDGIDQDCDGNDTDADADGVSVDQDCDDQDPTRAGDCADPTPWTPPPADTPKTTGCGLSAGWGSLAWVWGLGLGLARRRTAQTDPTQARLR